MGCGIITRLAEEAGITPGLAVPLLALGTGIGIIGLIIIIVIVIVLLRVL